MNSPFTPNGNQGKYILQFGQMLVANQTKANGSMKPDYVVCIQPIGPATDQIEYLRRIHNEQSATDRGGEGDMELCLVFMRP